MVEEKVIVLMSTYNGERFLREQIDSILQQKGCVIRLIVRDDGSNDATISILNEYQEKKLLEWYSDGMNLGAAKSFIKLIMEAPRADYYAFADQDDIWNSNKIESAIEMLRNHTEPAIYYSNAQLVDSSLNPLGENVYSHQQKPTRLMALCSCNVLGCTMVFNENLAVIVKNGKMPNKLLMHDNYICAVCSVCEGNIIYDDTTSMMYRQHGGNVIGVTVNNSIKSKIKEKIKWITNRRDVSIADQCLDILLNYSEISEQGRKDLQMVIDYNKKNSKKMKLFCKLIIFIIKGNATKHELLNSIKILFGNA